MYAWIYLLNQIRNWKIMWFSFTWSLNYVRSLTMKFTTLLQHPFCYGFLPLFLHDWWKSIVSRAEEGLKPNTRITSTFLSVTSVPVILLSASVMAQQRNHFYYLCSLITVPPACGSCHNYFEKGCDVFSGFSFLYTIPHINIQRASSWLWEPGLRPETVWSMSQTESVQSGNVNYTNIN